MPTPGTLAEYLGDIKKFTDGVAAPLVGEGAQIAYLLTGITGDFFSYLNAKLTSPLEQVAEFSDRPHWVSRHVRATAPGLRLHHLAMRCG